MNNPVNFNDPSGHIYCGQGVYCGEGEVNGSRTAGTRATHGNSSCNAPWPWNCSNNPPEPEDPEAPLSETSGMSGATPDPWCGGDPNIHPECPGDVYFHRLDTDPIDGYAISINFAAGFEQLVFFVGLDLVWTSKAWVLFMTTPRHLDATNELPFYSTHDFVTPQLGVSGTYSEITSAIMRVRPGHDGIVQAWSGAAVQEGGSLFFGTVNSSSSVYSNGNANFETTSTGGGYGFGIPDIIFEYHQYITNAEPIWPPPLP